MNAGAEAVSGKGEPTTFRCLAPQATSVCLAGDFNAWNPDAATMAGSADGCWSLELALEPGRYEYKFVIDGAWHCEPSCETPEEGPSRCVSNPFGSKNSVVEVT